MQERQVLKGLGVSQVNQFEANKVCYSKKNKTIIFINFFLKVIQDLWDLLGFQVYAVK
jgi:hypothetical protein